METYSNFLDGISPEDVLNFNFVFLAFFTIAWIVCFVRDMNQPEIKLTPEEQLEKMRSEAW
jgi:hypothetical protein